LNWRATDPVDFLFTDCMHFVYWARETAKKEAVEQGRGKSPGKLCHDKRWNVNISGT
jgi:hypothetical protein